MQYLLAIVAKIIQSVILFFVWTMRSGFSFSLLTPAINFIPYRGSFGKTSDRYTTDSSNK